MSKCLTFVVKLYFLFRLLEKLIFVLSTKLIYFPNSLIVKSLWCTEECISRTALDSYFEKGNDDYF